MTVSPSSNHPEGGMLFPKFQIEDHDGHRD